MAENDWLVKRFEEHRENLRAVAHRMLGSWSEADDAVQDVWLRLSRSDASQVGNLGGWLTTVVARLCLDVLRSRESRREQTLTSGDAQERRIPDSHAGNPESQVALADAVGPALLVVLEALAPAERVAFVLHDLFDVPFESIASILDRSSEAVRQLASRARRRVQGARAPDIGGERQREVVTAFLAASRNGDLAALLAVLAPDVVLRADDVAVRTAAAAKAGAAPALLPELRGAAAVANAFKGRAQGALPALIDGREGAVWAMGGKTRAAFIFTVDQGQITEIELAMEVARIAELQIELRTESR